LSLGKDGLLGGIPTHAGSWSVWVELSDEDPPPASWCRPAKSEREFTIQVSAPPVELGRPYALALGASGDPPHAWAISSGNFRSAWPWTQRVELSPERLSVVDSKGGTGSFAVTINVSPRLALATTALPSARFRAHTAQECGRPAVSGA
jgi:hypothetical protein